MEIIKKGNFDTCICDKCHSELKYNKYDLQWTHTEEYYYYIICPVCAKIIWIPGDKRHQQMFKEAWDERRAKENK